MKITILGSSGQIGAYLTEYLRERNHQIYEFDVVNGQDEDLTVIPNPKCLVSFKNAGIVQIITKPDRLSSPCRFSECCV